MSNGQEKVPIQCCNAVDNEHPDLVNYTKERQFHSDVFINPDEDFLVCCDCEDDCAVRLEYLATELVEPLSIN